MMLAVALMGAGVNGAWGQVTSYSNDYEDATPNVDWTSGNTGRYTVTTVTADGNTYLRSNYQNVTNNNGAVITCDATNGKVVAGTDFYMSFDLWLRGANTKSQNASFYIYDSGNSASTPILKITQNNTADAVDYNNWTVNNETSLEIDNANWYSYVITRIGAKEYLTVTKKSNGSKVLDMVEITSLSTNGGLGKLVFNTAKAWAHHAIDNVVVRALVAPAFTLSATEVTPAVGDNATVNVTGITGTISVSSDNTSAATASYSDGTITINGVADGVANITVTAVNDGAKTTQTIVATVGSVATTTVTVNYLCGGSPIAEATTIDDVTVGSTLTASDITYSETIAGVGCRYVNPSFSVDFPYVVEEDGVINITYTQQNAVSSLNVYANVNSTNYLLKSYDLDGKYVGDAVTVTCPEYYLLDGTLYSTANHGSGGYYKWSHTLTGDDLEITYGTTEATNVVYYAEAENIEGATANSSSNADIRCSDAAGAYFGAETNIVTLPAGSYTIYTQVWGGHNTDDSKNVTFTFKAGDTTIREHKTNGSLNPGNSSFDLTESKTITVSASGSSGKVLDLVYIVQTGVSGTITSCGWSTFASPYALDLSTISGGTAYYASAATGSKVTLTSTTATVPAGEGIMVKGTAGETFTINVAASGTAITGNLLKGQTTTGNVDASTSGTYHYVFGYKSSSEYGFYNLAADTEVAAGKAYLETTTALSPAASRLTIVFGDETTGITSVNGEGYKADGYYNLAGQRVDAPKKGLYIVDGKKVLVK